MYAAHFGFKTMPFNGLPDADGLYRSIAFNDAHEALCRAITQGKELMLLTGASGVGKTTLMQHLQASLERDSFTVLVSAASSGPGELIDACRTARGLTPMARAHEETGQVCGESIAEGERPQRGVVILVDDVHTLPDSILQSLPDRLAPSEAGRIPVQVILTGQPGFELRDFDLTPLAQSVELRCSLLALREEEVGPYIRRKLTGAGYEGAELFSEDFVHGVAQDSRGIPKRIDTVCGMALLIACDSGRQSVDRAMLAEAIDDLEGSDPNAVPVRAQPTATQELEPLGHPGTEDQLRTAPAHRRLWQLASRLGTGIQAAARRMDAASTRTVHAVYEAGLEKWRILRETSRSRAAETTSSAQVQGAGFPPDFSGKYPPPEWDWLGLKVGFVGLVALFLVALLLVILITIPGDERPPATAFQSTPSRMSEEKSRDILKKVIPGSDVPQLKLAELQRKQHLLERTLEQVQKSLLDKQELIDEQQLRIERLRERETLTEAKLAAVLAKTAERKDSTTLAATRSIGMRGDKYASMADHKALLPSKATAMASLEPQAANMKELLDAAPTSSQARKTATPSVDVPSDTSPRFVTDVERPASARADTVEAGAASVPDVFADPAQSRLPPVEERPIMAAALDSQSEPSTAREQVGDGIKVEPEAKPIVASKEQPKVSEPPKVTPLAEAPTVRLPADAGAAELSDGVYLVVRGDTLSEIGRRFGATVAELRRSNNLTSDRLSIGQPIRVARREGPKSTPNPELLAAAVNGQLWKISDLLDAGAAVDARDKDGKSALVHAASHGHVKAVRLLTDNGANINLRTKSGGTALSYAAWNDHPVVIMTLLRRGADINTKDNEGRSPLIFATINGHAQIVRQLLDYGADVNARTNDDRTALSAAVWNGYSHIARTLLENGAKVNAKTSDGSTALIDAAWNGDRNMVFLLLEHGADPTATNKSGLTPVAAAEQQGHTGIASVISRSLPKSS